MAIDNLIDSEVLAELPPDEIATQVKAALGILYKLTGIKGLGDAFSQPDPDPGDPDVNADPNAFFKLIDVISKANTDPAEPGDANWLARWIIRMGEAVYDEADPDALLTALKQSAAAIHDPADAGALVTAIKDMRDKMGATGTAGTLLNLLNACAGAIVAIHGDLQSIGTSFGVMNAHLSDMKGHMATMLDKMDALIAATDANS